jgi:DNA-binding transcriptional LysR family regulator
VIRYARLIQTDLAHLREEIIGIMSGQGGRVAVGTIMGAVPLLTAAISRVIADNPQMSVEIVEDTSAALLAQVDAGRLDLAICRTTVSNTPYLYESTVLVDETLAVIASTKHPFAYARRLSLKDLADYRWVVYRANMPMRMLLEREFHEADLRFPVHLLETTSAFATLSLLQENPSLVALVSTDVANFCSAYGFTTTLALPITSRSEPYELVSRKGMPDSPAARLLRGSLLTPSR